MVSNPGDQNRENSGLPNFPFLTAPGQFPYVQNPFSGTGTRSLENFQMATPSVGYLGFSGTKYLVIFRIGQMRFSLFQMQEIRAIWVHKLVIWEIMLKYLHVLKTFHHVLEFNLILTTLTLRAATILDNRAQLCQINLLANQQIWLIQLINQYFLGYQFTLM